MIRLLLLLMAASGSVPSAWLPPTATGVQVTQEQGRWKIASANNAEFSLESVQRHDAKAGDAFEIGVRIQVGLTTRALPELVCYDSQDREIPIASSLATANPNVTTNWQSFQKVFPAQPGTASVRARIRASGRGEVLLSDLTFRPIKVDAYQTGALITQPHAKTRTGVVLESNHGIEIGRASCRERV